jgi:hypothetical protein
MQSSSSKCKLYFAEQQWKAYRIMLYTKFVKEFSAYCPGRLSIHDFNWNWIYYEYVGCKSELSDNFAGGLR